MLVRRDERGVTLVEVMIVIVVLGIIVVPLGTAFITYLRHTDDVTARLSASSDAQIAAAYFTQDVQSIGRRDWGSHNLDLAQSIATGVARNHPTFGCGPAGTPASLVTFLWDDPAAATGTPNLIRVAYVVASADGERQLRRIACAGGDTSTVVLAHNVDQDSPGNPAVRVTCSTSCTAVPPPQYVTLTLRIKDPANGGSYTVTLAGQRRQT